MKEQRRIIIPFHGGKILHPKIVTQVPDCVDRKGMKAKRNESLMFPLVSPLDF